jgi:hypothetical protein
VTGVVLAMIVGVLTGRARIVLIAAICAAVFGWLETALVASYTLILTGGIGLLQAPLLGAAILSPTVLSMPTFLMGIVVAIHAGTHGR